jgi:hypothetical protein
VTDNPSTWGNYVTADTVADDLVITRPQRVPGISLTPATTVLGDDVRSVLNDILLQRGFGQHLPKAPWLGRMQSARPAVLIDCYVKADTAEQARTFGREAIQRLLDLMTLRRGAAARLIAGIVTGSDDPGRCAIRDIWIEHTGYHGNLLGGVIAGEDVHQLQNSWAALQANTRAQFWISLYADAVRDSRWDYQFFRCFSLLEAIADTQVPRGVDILDGAGNLRPLPRDKKKHFTTSGTQGKIYALLTKLAGGAEDDQLWDEVVVWAEIRHEVAHEGAWEPPHQGETVEHAATRAAIIGKGDDGTFEGGSRAIVKRIRNTVGRVLNAAIHGLL